MPPLTDLIGQSAEAGLPLGNSCKQFPPSPPPPCLPPRLPRACSRFPAPSGRPTFRSWLPSTPRASPPPEPRLKMRPSVRCAQPAEGRARGEESWQRIRGARRRSPRAASPESHLSPGASVASKSVSVTHNRFPWAAEDAAGPRGARGRLTSYFQEPLADRVGCLADRCLLLGGYGSEVAGRGLVGGAHCWHPLASTPSGKWDWGGHRGSQEGRDVSRHEKNSRTCLGNKGSDC